MKFFKQVKRILKAVPRIPLGVCCEIVYWAKSYLSTKKGVRDRTDGEHLIISLTSYSKRLKWIVPCLESLLSQSLRPDKVILWVAHEDQVPKSVIRLQKKGLEIRRVEDIKSYKKYIYARQEFPDSLIAIADDDVVYARSWLEGLYQAYLENPRSVLFYSGRNISLKKDANGKVTLFEPYTDWSMTKNDDDGKTSHTFLSLGGGGVLFSSSHNHTDLFKRDLFLSITPTSDDIWFKIIALLNEMPYHKVGANKCAFKKAFFPMYLMRLLSCDDRALRWVNNEGGGNDLALSKIVSLYPDAISKIEMNESRQS